MARKSDGNPFDKARDNLNTMRGRIEEILHRLGQLAEGKDWAEEAELGDADGKGLRGVYGFSVRVGAAPGGGRPDVRVEPFGTVPQKDRAQRPAGRTAAGPTSRAEREQRVPVREVREPLVDVIEEDDGILVVAELPGIAIEQLVWTLSGDVLELSAEAPGSTRAYQKEVLLPAACTPEGARLGGTNGVIELRLRRAAS
ncbi:MAG: hypothetical protein U1A78_35680 [Polyangia bacterium]